MSGFRRICLSAAVFVLSACVAMADKDKGISFSRLPEPAKEFLYDNFPDGQVSYVKQEEGFTELTYEVMLVNGLFVEFDRNGHWTKVEFRYGVLPRSLVPDEIRKYADRHWPDSQYRRIVRDKKYYMLKFKSGLELKFDRHFNFIGADE